MDIRRIMQSILSLLFIAAWPLWGATPSQAPQANQGALNLETWDFAKHGLVRLEGSYAFTWDQFMEPDHFPTTVTSLQVPGPWTKGEYPVQGRASYQLRLKVPAQHDLHLMTLLIAPNARIFINGVEQANFGQVGTSPKAEVMAYPQRYHVFPLPQDAEDVLITVHIENRLERPAGILQPFLLGTPDQLVAFERGTKILDGIILGSVFALFLYHIFLYVLRPKDLAPLFFGLCLFACFFYWLIAGYTSPINAFWDIPDADRLTVFFMIFFVVPAFSEFVHRAYPGLFPARFLKPFWAATAVCFVVVALVPYQSKFVAMSIYFSTVFPTAAFLCGRTVWRAHRRGDHGSKLFLAGILILAASAVHDDLMYRYAFSNFPLIGWGVVSFSLIQSYFISARFSQAFTRAEKSEAEVKALNSDLEKIIDAKTRDIRSIMENIPLAVFMFDSRNFGIHKDYSVHSRRIFARQDLQGLNALDLLLHRSQLTDDEKHQVLSAVQSSLDEQEWNFETNAHCLPREIIRHGSEGRDDIFELSWSPITNAEGLVQRLLVTLRDVTALRQLERKAREQNELLEILGEILKVPPPRFLNFMLDARMDLAQCRDILQSAVQPVANELITQLFIILHTLKGRARALPLRRLTDVLHQVEQILAEQRDRASIAGDLTLIQNGLDRIMESVEHYARVAEDRLNRTLTPEPQPALPPRPLHDVLDELTQTLPALAQDLQKPRPRIEIAGPRLWVTDEGDRLLQHVFIHILRNALDHGLESADERRDKGKVPEGTLQMTIREHTDHVLIQIRDDGRGLALERLRQLGREHGFADHELIDDERVAELVFQSGYSTARQLSEISGRGVGMHAVRQFVAKKGGQVQLKLDPASAGLAFRSFTLDLILPWTLFQGQSTAGVTGAA